MGKIKVADLSLFPLGSSPPIQQNFEDRLSFETCTMAGASGTLDGPADVADTNPDQSGKVETPLGSFPSMSTSPAAPELAGEALVKVMREWGKSEVLAWLEQHELEKLNGYFSCQRTGGNLLVIVAKTPAAERETLLEEMLAKIKEPVGALEKAELTSAFEIAFANLEKAIKPQRVKLVHEHASQHLQRKVA